MSKYANSMTVVCAVVASVVWMGPASAGQPGQPLERHGDEIMVAGQLFHTGTKVVLWTDPGGYDTYRVQPAFGPRDSFSWETSQERGLPSPNRYDVRYADRWSDDQFALLRRGNWELEDLQKVVNKFVIHYDVTATSQQCFKVLHDVRGISVHFLLDADGTIYQTFDLKDASRQTGDINDNSIGVEIANIGAYPPNDKDSTLSKWYGQDDQGNTILTLPKWLEPTTAPWPEGFVARPARNEPVTGVVQGQTLQQYDFTPQQYDALIKLAATLSKVFPDIQLDVPRDEDGKMITDALEQEDLDNFHGIVGHFHVTKNKIDPGPAFQWDTLLEGARQLVGEQAERVGR